MEPFKWTMYETVFFNYVRLAYVKLKNTFIILIALLYVIVINNIVS